MSRLLRNESFKKEIIIFNTFGQVSSWHGIKMDGPDKLMVREREFRNRMVREILVIWSITKIHVAAAARVCFNAVSSRTYFFPYDLMQGVCYIKNLISITENQSAADMFLCKTYPQKLRSTEYGYDLENMKFCTRVQFLYIAGKKTIFFPECFFVCCGRVRHWWAFGDVIWWALYHLLLKSVTNFSVHN